MLVARNVDRRQEVRRAVFCVPEDETAEELSRREGLVDRRARWMEMARRLDWLTTRDEERKQVHPHDGRLCQQVLRCGAHCQQVRGNSGQSNVPRTDSQIRFLPAVWLRRRLRVQQLSERRHLRFLWHRQEEDCCLLVAQQWTSGTLQQDDLGGRPNYPASRRIEMA